MHLTLEILRHASRQAVFYASAFFPVGRLRRPLPQRRSAQTIGPFTLTKELF